MIPASKQEASKLVLRTWPDPILRVKCEPVDMSKITAQDLSHLLQRMHDVMVASRGIGLAAPQIGVPLRIFVISPTVLTLQTAVCSFVNPTVYRLGDGEDMNEGCLSLPGLYSNIRRSPACFVHAANIGAPVRLVGQAAQVAQHENDHLNGKLQLANYWRGR